MTDVTRVRIEATLLWAVLCGVIALGFMAGRNVQVQSEHERRILATEHLIKVQQDQSAQTNVRLASMQVSLDALVKSQDAERFRSMPGLSRYSTQPRTTTGGYDAETRH